MNLEAGTVFLRAGFNPLTVEWFNGSGALNLNVQYAGPDFTRRTIPDSILWRAEPDSATGRTNFKAGLDYRSYEGDWQFLPDFAKLQPARTGVSTNFDLS